MWLEHRVKSEHSLDACTVGRWSHNCGCVMFSCFFFICWSRILSLAPKMVTHVGDAMVVFNPDNAAGLHSMHRRALWVKNPPRAARIAFGPREPGSKFPIRGYLRIRQDSYYSAKLYLCLGIRLLSKANMRLRLATLSFPRRMALGKEAKFGEEAVFWHRICFT